MRSLAKFQQELDIDPRTGVLLWRQHAPNVSSEFANFLDCAIHMNAQKPLPSGSRNALYFE